LKYLTDAGDGGAQVRSAIPLFPDGDGSIDFSRNVYFFKLLADRGNAFGQNNYGIYLQIRTGLSRDLNRAADYLKLSADQGYAVGQCYYGLCLATREGASIDLRGAAHYFKLSADQGYGVGQCIYGICLQNGKGVSIDLRGAAHYFKLSADQGNADGQCCYGSCLETGTGVSTDLAVAAHYFKLSADQGYAVGQYEYGMHLQNRKSVSFDFQMAAHYLKLAADQKHARAQYHYAELSLTAIDQARNLRDAVHYFRLAAENGNTKGQFVASWMDLNSIGTSTQLFTPSQYNEQLSVLSPFAAVCWGWCFRTGLGVPIDFTIAAELFIRAADSQEANGSNSFGCCLERGDGVAVDIEMAAIYYAKAASIGDPNGLYNIGRCLEFGKGIEGDFDRSAKYYRLGGERNDAAALNSFGTYLERGIGVQRNLALAAHYYQQSAIRGHSGGANNLGFCLEHGRGVQQNIQLAAEYYKFAADHGHSEASLNYGRCLRLLGCWELSEQSSEIRASPPSDDRLTKLFIDCLNDAVPNDRETAELLTSIERLKASIANPNRDLSAAKFGDESELGHCGSAFVRLIGSANESLMAVKIARNVSENQLIERDAEAYKMLKHPLVVGFDRYNRECGLRYASILTEVVGNGSLACHLPFVERNQCHFRRANRVARIVVGIVVAMQFIHSRGIVHGNLSPDNILLDWNWNVKIASFWHCTFLDDPRSPNEKPNENELPSDMRYHAPEWREKSNSRECDVFSFGLILYEIIVGQPVFPETFSSYTILRTLALHGVPLDIPDCVLPQVRDLISDCCEINPRDQPLFDEILNRLNAMRFKLTANVN
jgi:TPR repeat protein/serine/threonine protein kinase